MRIGRYRVYYEGILIEKVWSLSKAYSLINNMVECGYEREHFTIDFTEAGFFI